MKQNPGLHKTQMTNIPDRLHLQLNLISRIYFIFVLVLFPVLNSYSQFIENPSFDSRTGEGAPLSWYVCTNISSPDIHGINGEYPGFDGHLIDHSPVNGRSFVVLKLRGPTYINQRGNTPPSSRENVFTHLLNPLLKNHCYELSIYLTYEPEIYMGSDTYVNQAFPVKFQVWGGTDNCDTSELLIQSGLITNPLWEKYTFRFIPEKDTLTEILLEGQWDNPSAPYNGAIIMDYISLTERTNDSIEVMNHYEVYYEENEPVHLTASQGLTYTWEPDSGLDRYDVRSPYITDIISTEYKVTILNRPYCYFSEIFNIVKDCDLNTYHTTSYKLDTLVGHSSAIQLNASDSYGNSYNWSPGTGLNATDIRNPVATVGITSVEYRVELKDIFDCSSYEKFTLNVVNCDTFVKNEQQLILDTLVNEGDQVQLFPVNGTVAGDWFPDHDISCTGCQNPLVSTGYSETYKVLVEDQYNCLREELFKVDIDIFIPNVITPNGDGKNDLFVISGLPPGSSIIIFDRYGKKVFESNVYDNSWEGRDLKGNLLETDTYWYIIDIPLFNTTRKGYVFVKR